MLSWNFEMKIFCSVEIVPKMDSLECVPLVGLSISVNLEVLGICLIAPLGCNLSVSIVERYGTDYQMCLSIS